MVLCANVIGVCVAPGPPWPSTSPAMTRTSAPPSCDDSSFTSFAFVDRLVPRRRELVLARQVHPQLDAVKHATALDQFRRRRLDVQDARARGHPLCGAVGDQATATMA